jgi:hypothetical protein
MEGIMLHERTMIVEKAKLEYDGFMLDFCKKYELTSSEWLQIIALNMAIHAKYMIRSERHGPNSDKGGDEA